MLPGGESIESFSAKPIYFLAVDLDLASSA
jgi:hypothetical protein